MGLWGQPASRTFSGPSSHKTKPWVLCPGVWCPHSAEGDTCPVGSVGLAASESPEASLSCASQTRQLAGRSELERQGQQTAWLSWGSWAPFRRPAEPGAPPTQPPTQPLHRVHPQRGLAGSCPSVSVIITLRLLSGFHLTWMEGLLSPLHRWQSRGPRKPTACPRPHSSLPNGSAG